jgi:glutathione peroxidase
LHICDCLVHLQYNELVELDKKYSSKGLVIIGAPCNQFGQQEPGSNAEIKKFAQARGVKFPMLSKLDVNGPDGTPAAINSVPCVVLPL